MSFQKEQLKGRKVADFMPVSPDYFEAYKSADAGGLHSAIFHGQNGAYTSLAITILPLCHSIKELIIRSAISGGGSPCPSTVMNEACKELQIVLDSAIQEIPSRVLIYMTGSFFSRSNLKKSREDMLSHLKDFSTEGTHQFFVKHNKMASEFISSLSVSAYKSMMLALERIEDIGLFHESEINPVALDYFSSLIERKAELEALYSEVRKENT